VVIEPGIHLLWLLKLVGWADDAHRPSLEHVRINHCGIEIRMSDSFLNGSGILPTL
jgi:hypothetical protein